MYKNNKFSLVLLMGGKGERFSESLPKQFHHLSGKKLYLHTLDAFYRLDIFDEIILSSPKDFIKEIEKDTKEYKNLKVIEGGKTRQKSSYKALLACQQPNYVVIHDSVRPFVNEKIIIDNIKAVIKYKAVDTCIKSADTLVEINNSNNIKKIPNRSFFLRGQTPQSFEYNLILNAHKKALQENILNATDDCQLVLKNNKIHVVDGDENNIKITTKLDLFLAEQRFRLKKTKISNIFKTSLENKVFAVIGASGGIGQEIVKFLLKEKAYPLEISRNSEYKTDITNFENVRETFEKIFKKYGKIDGIINSAGHFLVKPFEKVTNKEIDELIKVNLLGLIYTCKEAKIKDFGHIINISSSSYSMGRKDYGIYSSAKAGVVNFTQSLALEFPKLFINTIIPQRTNTKMRKQNFPNEDEKLLLDPKKVASEIIKLLKQNLSGNIIEIKK